jgi:hypothetical protein
MSFKFRVKNYKDEEGEYSEYLPCDKDSILKIIDDNWTYNNPNGLQVISILNNSGQSLLLEHFGKHVFDVYYLPTAEGFHFHKKSSQELIYYCLELFMANNINSLESSLNKTKKDDEFIRKEFFFIDHDYKLTKQRESKELISFLAFGIPYGLVFLGMGFMLALEGPIAATVLALFILAIGTYAWLPGLLLHFQYKTDSKNLLVRLTRGSKIISINYHGTKKKFDKNDIHSVTKFQNPAYRNPWSDYGYTEIKFKTGEIINLTNLMVDQLFILDKFANDNVETKTINKLIPRLRNMSKVK